MRRWAGSVLAAVVAVCAVCAVCAWPAVASAAPAAAAAALTGKLSGHAFTPTQLVFRDGVEHQTIELNDGGADDCAHVMGDYRWLQIAPKQLVADGTVVRLDDATVLWKWDASSVPKERALELTIERIDRDARAVTGTIALHAADGTDLRGAFRARYCGTREVVVAKQQPVHGVDWDLAAAPKKLPAKKVTGWFLGKAFTPAAVSLVGWEGLRGEGVKAPAVLTFYAAKPADLCAEAVAAKGDRFVATLDPEKPVKAGQTVEHSFGGRTADGTWFEDPETPNTLFGTHSGHVAVRIDSLDRRRRVAKGRVYLAIDDAGKSLLVGAFTATYCKDPTGY